MADCVNFGTSPNCKQLTTDFTVLVSCRNPAAEEHTDLSHSLRLHLTPLRPVFPPSYPGKHAAEKEIS